MSTIGRILSVAVVAALFAAPASQAETAQYTYDELGRLIQVVYSNGKTITYSYDAAGNRTATVTTP